MEICESNQNKLRHEGTSLSSFAQSLKFRRRVVTAASESQDQNTSLSTVFYHELQDNEEEGQMFGIF